MKICILGFGKMGSWLANELTEEHEVTVYDPDISKCKKVVGVNILNAPNQIKEVEPQILINSVSLQNTIDSFRTILQYLPKDCMLCDVASVKTDLPAFYREAGYRFVSLHPMFGPTFATLTELRHENAVIIRESNNEGKEFFHKLFQQLGVNIFEYSFSEHDVMMAYSLTLPFVSSMVFSSCVSTDTVPGTTFKRHLEVARGLLSEDDFLLAEIIFNPNSLAQLEKINNRLNFLWHIVKNRDTDEALRFFKTLRENIQLSTGENGNKDKC
ncbi:MAG: prephenate dehydrogenase [Ignavibacteriales bacterium]|nr:prephenate dehydrogenase [Ignavibacteriales bacterium]